MRDPLLWSGELLREHGSHIVGDAARAAFNRMVVIAERLRGYRCAPGLHGVIRDFKYHDAVTSESPFAFIVNRNDLLVRRDATRPWQ